MAPEEQAYEDEQFETTVTVEEFDVSAPVDGPRRPGRNDHRPAKPDKRPRDKNARSGSSRPSSKGKTR